MRLNESSLPALIRSAVIGLAVGDAFGMPYECCIRGAYDIYATRRESGRRYRYHRRDRRQPGRALLRGSGHP